MRKIIDAILSRIIQGMSATISFRSRARERKNDGNWIEGFSFYLIEYKKKRTIMGFRLTCPFLLLSLSLSNRIRFSEVFLLFSFPSFRRFFFSLSLKCSITKCRIDEKTT